MTLTEDGTAVSGDESTEDGKNIYGLAFDARSKGGLISLHLVNVVFLIVTAMIYRFWAITRVRKALWSRMSFAGSAFEYTGTAMEIFIGFCKAVGFIVIPYIVVTEILGQLLLSSGSPRLASNLSNIFAIPVALFYTAARFMAYRYRVNRTSWRSIRAAVVGSPWEYAFTVFLAYLHVFATLGLTKPLKDMKVVELRIEALRIAGHPVRCNANTQGLWPPYLYFWGLALATGICLYFSQVFTYIFLLMLAQTTDLKIDLSKADFLSLPLLLTSVVLGVVTVFAYFNYMARFWHNVAQSTFYSMPAPPDKGGGYYTLRPDVRVTGGSLLALWLGNLLIVTASLGLLAPLAWLRKGHYLAENLRFVGNMDFTVLSQEKFDPEAAAEGFLGDFDLS